MIYIGFNLDKNMTTNKKIYVILRSEGHRKHKYMQDWPDQEALSAGPRLELDQVVRRPPGNPDGLGS